MLEPLLFPVPLQAACATARVGESSSVDARLPGGSRRRLLALKDGRGGALGDADGAAARLCALQCLQHACISWHKIYMGGSEQAQDGSSGEGAGSEQPPEAVPAAATECLAQCGAAANDASCLALVRPGAQAFMWLRSSRAG